MKTLILNIDRDDDFGRKANVKSPIIGVEQNIDAANKLGRIDPEDSDLNAIFLAVATYDTLKKEGKDVEVATICGNISVGVKSDQILAEQLEEVIKQTDAKDVIFVSDGAEDEYILPIIQSRIMISSIKRVTVKQSKALEDTYYRIIKLLDDDKVKKQFMFPIALIIIVGAVFVLLDMVGSGFGAILFTLGVYLLIRVFNVEKNIIGIWVEIKSGFLTAKISFYTYIVAFIVFGISLFYAWNLVQPDIAEGIPWIIPLLSFLKNIVWGIAAAGLISVFGRVTDIYVREKKVRWSYWIIPFSLLGFSFISSAVFESLYISLRTNIALDPFFTPTFIGNTAVGVLIAFIGAVTYHYIKDTYGTEKHELEIEKTTTIHAKKT